MQAFNSKPRDARWRPCRFSSLLGTLIRHLLPKRAEKGFPGAALGFTAFVGRVLWGQLISLPRRCLKHSLEYSGKQVYRTHTFHTHYLVFEQLPNAYIPRWWQLFAGFCKLNGDTANILDSCVLCTCVTISLGECPRITMSKSKSLNILHFDGYW